MKTIINVDCSNMRILSVGKMNGISNTCVHRNWALQSIADHVDVVDTFYPITIWVRILHHLFLKGFAVKIPDYSNANNKIKSFIDDYKYDCVWIDKGITIYAETLKYIKEKQPTTKIVGYSPDEMSLRHNQSQQYLECVPYYDFIITTKSYCISDMIKLGAHNVIFVNNAYEKKFHHIYEMTDDDYLRLGADVGFVGSYEKDRCESILYLAEHGIKVTVWGSGKWLKYKNFSKNLDIRDGGLYSEDYSKSFKAIKISLCFLRKLNFDQQTTRSVEIPACGGFMLAERTDEHLSLFKEDIEAVYFSSNDELLQKCKYYLEHEDERIAIARAGYRRCLDDDYSNDGMVKRVLDKILQ